VNRLAPAARAQRIAFVAVLGLAALDAWRFLNYQANPDGISYVDMALAFARGDAGALVNAYWSPLLPALIGIAYRVMPPTVDTMYPIAHLVTVASFVVSAFAYRRFVATVVRRAALEDVVAAWLVSIAWAAFLLFVVRGIGIWLITPDMGVAAVAFWAAADLLELGEAPWPARRWVIAGIVLAVGYWWKAIVFPVALVWLAAAALVTWRRRDGFRGPATSAVTFGALAAVVAVPISLAVGRPTFGETGRLNYLWYASNATYVWERCVPPEGLDANAARFGAIAREEIISRGPLTCRFLSDVHDATMPQWADPSLYYRDAHVAVDPTRQWLAIRNDVTYVATGLWDAAPLLGIALLLLGAGAALAGARRVLRGGIGAMRADGVGIALLATAPVAFYLLVYVEFRHVAPFILAGGVFAAFAMARATSGARTRTFAMGLALLAAVDIAWRLSAQTLLALLLLRGTLTGRGPERIPVSQAAARALIADGFAPGTHTVSINASWNGEWAQLSGLKIRAHVPEWTLALPTVLRMLRDDCAREAWDANLRAAGIEVAVARIPSGQVVPPTFAPLGDTDFYVHRTAVGAPACAIRSSSGTGGR
jgi:hypothetical protein